MENKKLPLPEHVIRAMRRDGGFIRPEIIDGKVRYVVNLRTVDGWRQHCTVSDADFKRLLDGGVIEPGEFGVWVLTGTGKEGK